MAVKNEFFTGTGLSKEGCVSKVKNGLNICNSLGVFFGGQFAQSGNLSRMDFVFILTR
jgi:hypothetical protein